MASWSSNPISTRVFKVVNVYTLVKVALPPKIILYWCDLIYFVILDKECFDSYADVAFHAAIILASSGAMLNRLLHIAWVKFCGSLESSAFSMTKIGLIAKAAIENSNKLFVCMRLLVRKNQEVVHLLCSSLAANPVITSLWQTGCSNYWHFFIRSFVWFNIASLWDVKEPRLRELFIIGRFEVYVEQS